MTSHLILGAVDGYEIGDVRIFVESLARSGYEGRTCLMTSGLSDETLSALARYDVEIWPCEGPQRLHRRARRLYLALWNALLHRAGPDAVERHGPRLFHIVLLRFLRAYDYLCARPGAFDGVLLTDVRDVLFQGDPFGDPLPAPVCIFEERRGLAIRDQPLNRTWLEMAYGRGALDAIGGRTVVCAGTIMGTQPGVVALLRLVREQAPRVAHVDRFGTDAAILQYLAHGGLVPGARIVPNGAGAVLTIGTGTPGDEFEIRDEATVVDRSGRVVPVVHQYDRHPELLAAVARQYGAAGAARG